MPPRGNFFDPLPVYRRQVGREGNTNLQNPTKKQKGIKKMQKKMRVQYIAWLQMAHGMFFGLQKKMFSVIPETFSFQKHTRNAKKYCSKSAALWVPAVRRAHPQRSKFMEEKPYTHRRIVSRVTLSSVEGPQDRIGPDICRPPNPAVASFSAGPGRGPQSDMDYDLNQWAAQPGLNRHPGTPMGRLLSRPSQAFPGSPGRRG